MTLALFASTGWETQNSRIG